MQAARNHKVKHEPKIAFEADGNSLAAAPQLANGATFGFGEWRLHGSQQERTLQPHANQWLTQDSRLERGYVSGNVRQFWHGNQMPLEIRVFQFREGVRLSKREFDIAGARYYRFCT